jgi:arginase family enzyme
MEDRAIQTLKSILRKRNVTIEETEPILRSSHLMMFDLNSLRLSDAPGTSNKSPNGLYAEEACQIIRYAGLSNRISSGLLSGWKSNFK